MQASKPAKNKKKQAAEASTSSLTNVDGPSKKRARTNDSPPRDDMQLVVSTQKPAEEAAPNQQDDAELMFRRMERLVLDVNPKFITDLSNRSELGYWITPARKVLTQRAVDLDVTEIRRCLINLLTRVMTILYFENGSMTSADILIELNAIVPVTVDICMSALYAKLRNINRHYGVHPTRYPTAPSYGKDTELPLPIALAIDMLGAFETQCLTNNMLYVPTFPENTQHEGRNQAAYPLLTYGSYKSTFAELKIPMKSIDPQMKRGTPWWTYGLQSVNSTIDLICRLPPSMYTDFSAQIRMLFLAPDIGQGYVVRDIIAQPANPTHYGFRAKGLRRGIHVDTFQALCHLPQEFWEMI